MRSAPARRLGLLATVAWCALRPPDLCAQDVVESARARGLVVPAELLQRVQANPQAFEFQRAWRQRVRDVRTNRALLEAREGPQLATSVIQAAAAAVTGELTVATVGALYSGQTLSYSAAEYAERLFGEAVPPAYSVRTYYRENSRGVFEVGGVVPDWPTLPSDATYYRPSSATDPLFGRTGEFLKDALDAVDAGVDFTQFDNDGADGVPNSGDDDGYVDVTAFLYQDAALSCGGSGIWPHRWVYSGWWGSAYATDDIGYSGSPILVDDYMIQGGLDCDGTSLMPIGTFAHELGHALNLVDLYDTQEANGKSEGIGHWGLMGSGNWNTEASPAHLSAWSKDYLGWVTVTLLPASASVSLTPVIDGGEVLRHDVPGTNEYFLLEHRVQSGSDANLHGPGLLVWHVDQDVIDATRAANAVNGDETRKGVDLEEADGLADLDNQVNRGDAGDPFPGSSTRTAFGPATAPSSMANGGWASGFSLANISFGESTAVTFDVQVETQPILFAWNVAMATARGQTVMDTMGLATHNGTPVTVSGVTWSQPWLNVTPTSGTTPMDLVLTADPTGLLDGTYTDYVQIASPDAASSPLIREVTLTVAGDVLTVGDSLVRSLAVPTQVDTFFLAAAQGDVIDLAVFPTPTSAVWGMAIEVVNQAGNWVAGGWTRYVQDGGYGGLIANMAVGADGPYRVLVWSPCCDDTGSYLLKTRPAGPTVATQPWAFMRFGATLGTAAVVDSLWVYNQGPQSVAWDATSSEPRVTLSPSSGTLIAAGPAAVDSREEARPPQSRDDPDRPALAVYRDPAAAPAGAQLVEVTVDLSGLPAGRQYWDQVLTFRIPSDPWGGESILDATVFVAEATTEVIAEGLPGPVRDIARLPDGALVMVTDGNLERVDPDTGARSTLAASVAQPWSLNGLAAAPDGTVYVADRYGYRVWRVLPDGTASVYWTLPGSDYVEDVTLAPDGTLYVVGYGTGLWRVDPDLVSTNLWEGPRGSGYTSVLYSPMDGMVYVSEAWVIYRYDPATSTAAAVTGNVDWSYDLDVGTSGRIYALHYNRISSYDPVGLERARFYHRGYGDGIAVMDGYLYATTDGCCDNFFDEGLLYRIPVADAPAELGTTYLTAPPGRILAPVGQAAADTVRVSTNDGSAVNVTATWSAAWLSVAPTPSTTPYDLVLTADATSLAAGEYTDTVFLASDAVGNSPRPVPVALTVSDKILVLGDSVHGNLSTPTEADTFAIDLVPGDTVDVAVFPYGASAIGAPRVVVIDKAGNRVYGGFRRTMLDGRNGWVFPRWVVGTQGPYRVYVYDTWSDGGEYVVKTRETGAVITGDPRDYMELAAPEGGGSVQDTIWVYNAGLGSVAWEATSADSRVTVSPSSGSLPAASAPLPAAVESAPGVVPPSLATEERSRRPHLAFTTDPALAPPGAQAVTVTADVSGMPADYYWLPEVLSFALPADPWAGPHVMGMDLYVHDADMTVLATNLPDRAGDVAVHPDGDLVMAVGGNLERVDPVSGTRTVMATGVSTSTWTLEGIAVGPDTTVYVADTQYGQTAVKAVRPDGTVSTVWLRGSGNVFDVTALPDGTLYAVEYGTGLYRIDTDGTVTQVASQGTYGHNAVLYNPLTGLVYYNHTNRLFTYDPATGLSTLVGHLRDWIENLDVGISGNLYVLYWQGISVNNPHGVELEYRNGPGWGVGIAVAQDAIFGTTSGCCNNKQNEGWLYSFPGHDSPVPLDGTFLNAVAPPMAAPVGTADTVTVTVTTAGGTAVGVKAIPSVSWLTAVPDSGTTSFDLKLVAHAGSLTPGLHTAKLTLTSSDAQNSPYEVPVTFDVVGESLNLGDDIARQLPAPGAVDSFYVALNAGDTVDIGLWPSGPSPLTAPKLTLYRPDGSLILQAQAHHQVPTPYGPVSVAIAAGQVVATPGVHRIEVGDWNGAAGEYLLKTRRSGAVLGWDRGFARIPAREDGSVGVDTLWIFNEGARSTTWTTETSGQAWLSVSPAGGTLPPASAATLAALREARDARGAPEPETANEGEPGIGMVTARAMAPPGAVPVVITVDPTGYPPGPQSGTVIVGMADGWSDPLFAGVQMRVYDTGISEVVRTPHLPLWAIEVNSDGSLVVSVPDTITGTTDLELVDPDTGARTPWIAAVSPLAAPGVSGLTRAPDGTLWMADRYGGQLVRILADGTLEAVPGATWAPYEVTFGPDGSAYVSDVPGIVKVAPDGTVSTVWEDVGHVLRPRGLTYYPPDGWIYFGGNDRAIHRVDPATGAEEHVTDIGWLSYGIEVGASGLLYVGVYGEPNVIVMTPEGDFVEVIFGPSYGYGISLTCGAIYGTTRVQPEMVYRVPVDDCPMDVTATNLVTDHISPVALRAGAFIEGQLEVRTSDGTVLEVTASTKSSWLTVESGPKPTPATFQARADAATLAPGFYEDTLTFTAAGAVNSPLQRVVKLRVTSGSAWIESTSAFQGDTVIVPAVVDISATGLAIGSMDAAVWWDPSKLRLLALESGDFQGLFEVNLDNAPAGEAKFAGVNTSATENVDTTVVARLKFEVLAAGGEDALLGLGFQELTATDFTNLLADVVALGGFIHVGTGLWGDPTGDGEITSMDALVCLTHTVDKPLPAEMDPAACDVAPDLDLDNNSVPETFNGTITSLDALAILIHVVGRPLPESYRVGKPR